MILAGTDTSSVTIGCAMSLLVNHPDILKKARVEIDTHVGQDCLIDEPDISKLHYLQAIISKTFQLFPAAPLLLPHVSSDDCTIRGFTVPRGTMWAIHRDPKIWNDSTSFKLERFEGGKVEGHKLDAIWDGKEGLPRGWFGTTCYGFGFGVINSVL
ncbi:unnamed protein product [Camellia sinensis]